MTVGAWDTWDGAVPGTCSPEEAAAFPMLDFAELVATPVGRCEDGAFHTLPSDQVELGLRELGGGIAKCERCGTIIYVPPGR